MKSSSFRQRFTEVFKPELYIRKRYSVLDKHISLKYIQISCVFLLTGKSVYGNVCSVFIFS